jgi:uncharacterized membrane protein YdjX (TVP38/TMEM64 family)
MPLRRGTLAFVLLILVLLAGIIVPFLVWGDQYTAVLSLAGAEAWMRQYGGWAWLAGIVLLIADIVLPIPGTVVMSALGWIYGWLWGGLTAAAGSFLSGMTAYLLCSWLGRPIARRIAGDDGLRRGERLFASGGGGWLVALSRWLPVLPEAVACLAGLSRMPLRPFLVALACGSMPLGFAFAAIGALGHDRPEWALALSAAVPVALWLVARRLLRRAR